MTPKRPWWKRWRFRILLLFCALFSLIFVTGVLFVIWTRSGSGPRIGVSVSTEWFDRLQVHRAPYDLAVKRAGGVVVTLVPENAQKLDALLDQVDGILQKPFWLPLPTDRKGY